MIFGKFWRWVKATFNKWGNRLRGLDPIAEMQYEVDLAADRLKDGRISLVKYASLTERAATQLKEQAKNAAELEANVRACLQGGDRDNAGKFALQLERLRKDMAENQNQFQLHEQSYKNNREKLNLASRKVEEMRENVKRYDAHLRMSRVEAEIAEMARGFNFDVNTDMGQAIQLVQNQIDEHRAQVRVAADLSQQDMAAVRHENEVEKARADQALEAFEKQGLVAHAPS